MLRLWGKCYTALAGHARNKRIKERKKRAISLGKYIFGLKMKNEE